MHIRPRLVRNIPFWILVVVSLGATIGGALFVKIELDWMTTALTANTATGVDVYVGQVAAVTASIVCGAGIMGLLLALTIAALAGLRAKHPVEAPAPIDWQAESSAPGSGSSTSVEAGADERTEAADERAEAATDERAAR